MPKTALNEWGLTAQQEHFAQLLSQNYNQSDAYRIAYPASESWLPKSVHEKASVLAHHSKVLSRVKELKDPVIEKFNKAREAMAQSIIDAATTAETDQGLPDHATRHKAAKTGLDYLGYQAPQKVQSVNVHVDMSKDDIDNLLGNL